MTTVEYNSFGTLNPFHIKVPFSEAELYFDNRLHSMTINNILSFEINYLRLSYKYKIGMPFHSLGYLKDSYEYEKKYVSDTYNYLTKESKINFLIQSMNEDDAIYSPLVSHLYYFKNGKIYSDDIIDVDGFKKRNDFDNNLIIHQPPFDVFGEGFNRKLIDYSQSVNELNFIMFHFGLGSSIFYPYIENKKTGKKIDNRVIAYRNAPRYNSFLRDLRLASINHGFEFCVNEDLINKMDRPFETRNGILLDGEIIFQEDIEEGTVKLPDFSFL